jgi:four helix bundle protein
VVWKKGLDLVSEIDRIVEGFSSYQRWSLGMQLHRAAYSIVLNIAEGHDHDYTRAYLRHLADAKGSVREVEAGVLVIRHCKYLPDGKTESALSLLNEIGRMLRSLSGRIRLDSLNPRSR